MNVSQVLFVDPAGAGERWSVDAGARLQSVLERPDTPALLRQTLSGAISWQTRNEMPVRQVLRAPRIASLWVAALLALGATVTVEEDDGPAEVPLEALLKREGEGKVSALHVVAAGLGEVRWCEAHVGRTPADVPIVAAVAVVEMDDPGQGGIVHQARVALTGVWPEPVCLAEAPAQLVGGPLDADRIQAVAEAVEGEVEPKGDFLGSEEYRRAMAGVLTQRALEACLHQEAG